MTEAAAATAASGKLPTRSTRSQQHQDTRRTRLPNADAADAPVTFGGGLAPKPFKSTRGGAGGAGGSSTAAAAAGAKADTTTPSKRLHKAGDQDKFLKPVQPKDDEHIKYASLLGTSNAMMDSDYDEAYGSEENAMSDNDEGIDPQDPAFLDHTKYYPVQLPWRPEDIFSSMTRNISNSTHTKGKGQRGPAVIEDDEDDTIAGGPSSKNPTSVAKSPRSKSKIRLRRDGLDFLRDPTILGPDELVMWQLPPVLPIPIGAKAVKGKEGEDKEEEEKDVVVGSPGGGKGSKKKNSAANSTFNGSGAQVQQQQIIDAQPSTFKQIPSGKIGKIRVYESGKIKMHIGEVVFDITPGIPRTCRQEVVGISEAKKKMIVLGHVVHSVVCVPDLDVLLQDQGGGAVAKTINTFDSNGGAEGGGKGREEGGRRSGREKRTADKSKVVGGVIEDSDDDEIIM